MDNNARQVGNMSARQSSISTALFVVVTQFESTSIILVLNAADAIREQVTEQLPSKPFSVELSVVVMTSEWF